MGGGPIMEEKKEDCFLLPAQGGIHESILYRFYWQNRELWGGEKTRLANMRQVFFEK